MKLLIAVEFSLRLKSLNRFSVVNRLIGFRPYGISCSASLMTQQLRTIVYSILIECILSVMPIYDIIYESSLWTIRNFVFTA